MGGPCGAIGRGVVRKSKGRRSGTPRERQRDACGTEPRWVLRVGGGVLPASGLPHPTTNSQQLARARRAARGSGGRRTSYSEWLWPHRSPLGHGSFCGTLGRGGGRRRSREPRGVGGGGGTGGQGRSLRGAQHRPAGFPSPLAPPRADRLFFPPPPFLPPHAPPSRRRTARYGSGRRAGRGARRARPGDLAGTLPSHGGCAARTGRPLARARTGRKGKGAASSSASASTDGACSTSSMPFC